MVFELGKIVDISVKLGKINFIINKFKIISNIIDFISHIFTFYLKLFTFSIILSIIFTSNVYGFSNAFSFPNSIGKNAS